jgi:hypothetical protein
MALINCELLRQALFLYVSMLGFIAVHMSNSLFGNTGDPVTNHTHIDLNNILGIKPNVVVDQAGSETGTAGSESGTGVTHEDINGIGLITPVPKPVLETNAAWEVASTCQTTFYQTIMAPTASVPIALLERFDSENVTIPLSACSTLHLQAPFSAVVWCGVTDPEHVMEELHTVSFFLSHGGMDVLVVEGGGHHAGLLGVLALSLGASVHVISPYSHYLGVLGKSAVLSKLPTGKLFLYHNQVSEIRGQVNLAYRASAQGYRNDCDTDSVGDEVDWRDEGEEVEEGEGEECRSEQVSTATMEQAANSLRYSSQTAPDSERRSLLVRATFTNIHQINGFLDSPDMFASWCVKVIIVDSALLGLENKAWLEKRLALLGYQAYALSGKALSKASSDHKLTVWTTSPFIPH